MPGLCFKIIHDHQKSRKRINSITEVASLETTASGPVIPGKRTDSSDDILSFVRVYNGELSTSSKLFNVNKLEKEFCDKIYIPYANNLKQVTKLTHGNIGIVSGLIKVNISKNLLNKFKLIWAKFEVGPRDLTRNIIVKILF